MRISSCCGGGNDEAVERVVSEFALALAPCESVYGYKKKTLQKFELIFKLSLCIEEEKCFTRLYSKRTF